MLVDFLRCNVLKPVARCVHSRRGSVIVDAFNTKSRLPGIQDPGRDAEHTESMRPTIFALLHECSRCKELLLLQLLCAVFDVIAPRRHCTPSSEPVSSNDDFAMQPCDCLYNHANVLVGSGKSCDAVDVAAASDVVVQGCMLYFALGTNSLCL